MSHETLVLIHLVGAVLFVGAIALEVFILEPIKKHIGLESFQKFEFHLFRAIKRRYWVAVLPLYITGFVMYFQYLESFGGFQALIATDFGKLLTLKLALAVGLLGIFLSAPFVFMRRQPNPIKHFFLVTGGWQDFRIDRFEVVHYLALAFGLGLVILGKVIWMV
jgi:hypothetical protein